MNLLTAITELISIFLFTTLFIFVARKVAKKIGLVDKPNYRKRHQGLIPLVGGISVYAGICFTFAIADYYIPHASLYLACAGVLVLVGALDDRFDISVKIRAVIQAAIAVIMMMAGNLHLSSLGFIFGSWELVLGPFGFFLTLFIGGPLLGYLLLRVAGVDGWALRLLPVVSLLALLVSIMVVVMQGSELATIRSSVQQASALVPDYGLLMAWRVVLLALALACWCVPQIRGRKPAVSLLGLAFVLILAGEMIGRGVFYGLHMTVGMAVAS